jgi:hypothetical protein
MGEAITYEYLGKIFQAEEGVYFVQYNPNYWNWAELEACGGLSYWSHSQNYRDVLLMCDDEDIAALWKLKTLKQ